MDRATRSVAKFGQDVTAAGQKLTIGLSLPMIGLAGAALKASADMESLKMGLTAVTGSAEATNRQLERLKEVAKLPGLGFKEAVQGAISLQAAGFSAVNAEKALRGFGNALATVGKGKADLDGVILALTQISAKGKVSAEEINQLQERLPQIRAAMKAAFGTADTEALKKMGIDSQEFIQKITAEFLKLPAVTSGLNNSFENLRDSAFQALSKIGDIMKPFAQNFIDGWVGPMTDKLKVFAEEFMKLPAPLRNFSLGAAALAATLPLATLALGSMITNAIVIAGAFSKLWAVAGSVAVAFSGQVAAAFGLTAANMTLLGVAGAAAAATMTLLLIPAFWKLVQARNAYKDAEEAAAAASDLQQAKLKQLEDSLRKNGAAIDGMSARYKAGQITFTQYLQYLRDVAVELGKTAKAHEEHGAAVMSTDKALTLLNLRSTAERKKDLADAQAAYAIIRKSGTENGIVLQEAANKVKAAHETLNGVLGKTAQKLGAAYHFGQKGLEAAILVEQIRQLNTETTKFIADAVKAGGLAKYNAQQALELSNAMAMLDNPPAIEGIGKMGAALHDVLSPAAALPPELQRIADALDAFGLSSKRADIDALQRNFDVLGEGMESGSVSVEQYTRAWLALIKAMDAAGETIDPAARREAIKLEKQYGGQLGETAKEIRNAQKISAKFASEVQRAWDGLTRGIARNIVEWKDWGATLKNIGKDLAASFLEIMIKGLFNKLKKQLADLLINAGGVFAKIGGWIGGTASQIGGTAASGAGSVGGAAAGAGGAASSAGKAASGLIGTIGAVGAAVGAVSSIIGNFQQAGMNKSLDVLVNHTLRIFNELATFRMDAWTREAHLMGKLDDMWRTGLDIKDILGKGGIATSGGKGVTFSNCNFSGVSAQAMMQAAFDQASLAGIQF